MILLIFNGMDDFAGDGYDDFKKRDVIRKNEKHDSVENKSCFYLETPFGDSIKRNLCGGFFLFG